MQVNKAQLDVFDKEVCRLHKWDYTTATSEKVKELENWRKTFLYNYLDKKPSMDDIAELLSGKVTPKENHLVAVITLMNVSKDAKEFKGLFKRKFGELKEDYTNIEEPPNANNNMTFGEFMRRAGKVGKPKN